MAHHDPWSPRPVIAGKSPPSRGMKVFLVVVVVAVAAVAAVVLWFVAVMSGGFDNLLDWHHPTRSSHEVVRARNEAVPRVDRAANDLADRLSQAAGLEVSGVDGVGEWCEEGQHNFKIDNDYDLLCTATHAVLLTGPADRARTQAEALVAALAADGYGPQYASAALDVSGLHDGSVADADLGSGGRYVRGALQVGVALAAADSPSYRFDSDVRRLQLRMNSRALTPGTTPGDVLPAGRYGVWLTVSETYFKA